MWSPSDTIQTIYLVIHVTVKLAYTDNLWSFSVQITNYFQLRFYGKLEHNL